MPVNCNLKQMLTNSCELLNIFSLTYSFQHSFQTGFTFTNIKALTATASIDIGIQDIAK